MDAADKKRELQQLDEALAQKQAEYNRLYQQTLKFEREARLQLRDLQKQVRSVQQLQRRLEAEALQYEQSMRATREADAERSAVLATHESNLKARERRLQQDLADFERRRQRFKQLQELTNAPQA